MSQDLSLKVKINYQQMEKLTGKKIDTAVFISGSGSNLNSIIKNSLKKKFPIKITLVISNNKRAYGINYAKKIYPSSCCTS